MSNPLSLNGMIIFTTRDVAESLILTETKNKKSRKNKLYPSEEILFKSIQQKFFTSEQIQRTLLYSFSNNQYYLKSNNKPLYFANLQRVLNSFNFIYNNYDLYCINFDFLYANTDNLFDDVYKWWSKIIEEIKRENNNENFLISNHPEIIIIVLSTEENNNNNNKTILGPGSMFPSLIKFPLKENKEEEKINMRLCGFPSYVNFTIPHKELQKLSLSHFSLNKSNNNNNNNNNNNGFIITNPKEYIITRDWCKATLISSDFMINSIFFLHWCIPSDFIWFSHQSKSNGWGCDVLGKLLRSVSTYFNFIDKDINNYNNNNNNCNESELESNEPLLKRSKSEHNEAFVDIVSKHYRNDSESIEHINNIKRNIDLRFVKKIHTTIHNSLYHQNTVKNILGHMKMIKETYDTQILNPNSYNSHILTTSNDFSLKNKEMTKIATRLLKEFEKIQESQSNNNIFNSSSFDNNNNNNNNNIFNQKFKTDEELKFDFFLLTRDAEKLLESLSVEEETLKEREEKTAELADVVEMMITYNTSLKNNKYKNINFIEPKNRIPSGILKTILKDSIMSYISSSVSDNETDEFNFNDNETKLKSNNNDYNSSNNTISLNVIGAAFLKSIQTIKESTNNGKLNNQFCKNKMNEILNNFWYIIIKHLGNEFNNYMITDYNNYNYNNDFDIPLSESHNFHKTDLLRLYMKNTASNKYTPKEGDNNNNNNNIRGVHWLKHLTFLLAHSSFQEDLLIDELQESTMQQSSEKVKEDIINDNKDCIESIIRGVEAHLFFLNVAICAINDAITTRWIHASEILKKEK